MRSVEIAIFISTISAVACCRTSASELIVFDAAGRAMGYFAGSCSDNANDWIIYSRNGYYGCFSIASGSLSANIPLGNGWAIYESGFKEPDCNGARYAYSNSVTAGRFYGGFLLASQHDRPAYAINDGALSTVLILQSNEVPFGGTCQNFTSPFTTEFGVEVYVNDVSVTAFSSVPYLGPLRVQPSSDEVLKDVIFFDGFD